MSEQDATSDFSEYDRDSESDWDNNSVIREAEDLMTPASSSSNNVEMSSPVSPSSLEERVRKIQLIKRNIVSMEHASRCRSDSCLFNECPDWKRLWRHITTCLDTTCSFPRCLAIKYCLAHYKGCRDNACSLCIPTRQEINEARLAAGIRLTRRTETTQRPQTQ